MNSKEATKKIVEILKQVKPEGHTKKAQLHRIYLMTKKVDPTIDKIFLTVGKSYNELNPTDQTVEKNKKVTAPIADPATEEVLEVGKGETETETETGTETETETETGTEDLGDLPLDTDLLSPKFQLKGLNVEQIKGWAKMQATKEKPKKKVLIEVAESLELATGGTIEELATAIHEKINAEK